MSCTMRSVVSAVAKRGRSMYPCISSYSEGSTRALNVRSMYPYRADKRPQSYLSSMASMVPPPPDPDKETFYAKTNTSPGSPAPDAEKSEKKQTESSGGESSDDFVDPQESILDAALDHVHELGWSTAALARGAKDSGLHAVAAGMFSRGGAELAEHFMRVALKQTTRHCEEMGDTFTELGTRDRLLIAMKERLKAVAPYTVTWPKAMAQGLLPENAQETAKALALLADELVHLSGDTSTDMSWYGKRSVVLGIYVSAELFMLTDKSEDFQDTWSFLERRLDDYENLTSAPETASQVLQTASTAAGSLTSAALSLASPFIESMKTAAVLPSALKTAVETGARVVASSLPDSLIPRSSKIDSSGAGGTINTGGGSLTYTTGGVNLQEDEAPVYGGAPEKDPLVGAQALKNVENELGLHDEIKKTS